MKILIKLSWIKAIINFFLKKKKKKKDTFNYEDLKKMLEAFKKKGIK